MNKKPPQPDRTKELGSPESGFFVYTPKIVITIKPQRQDKYQ